MRKFLFITLSTFILFLLSNIVQAADLLTVFQQALMSDPEFAAADAQRMANEEGVPISRAALLTNVSGTAFDQGNKVDVDTTNSGLGLSQGTSAGNPSLANFGIAGSSNFNTHGYALNASQPLFNFEDWMLYRQAQDTATQADYTYGAELQDLILRVATAYFNVLLAEDTLTATVAQKQANLESLQQIKARYQVGLETMTDVY